MALDPKRSARGRRGSVSAEVTSAQNLKDFAKQKPEVLPIRTCINAKNAANMSRSKVKLVIADHLLFEALDEKQKNALCDCFFLREYSKGDTVIRQGEEGNLFYVVEEGGLSVYKKPENTITGYEKVETYGPGASFGELALMYNQPRAATVRVESPQCLLWIVDRRTVQQVVQTTIRQRNTFLYESLQKVHLFKQLADDQLARLTDSIELQWIKTGDDILTQEHDSQSLCVLVEGSAAPIQDGNSQGLKMFLPGDYFGELAQLAPFAPPLTAEDAPRSATIKASEDCLVFIIDMPTLERLLGPCNEIFGDKSQTLDP